MSERHAWICTHSACVPPIRRFVLPGEEEPPKCPEHGTRTMIRQVNVRYRPDPAVSPDRIAVEPPPRAARRAPAKRK